MKTLVICSALITAWLMPKSLTAEEPALSESQIREYWGRVIYCDRTYRRPENRSRVYEYDLAQCSKAADRMRDQALLHGEGRVKILEDIAGQRATQIEYSTPDATAVINACRESCRELAMDPDGETSTD
jgi:hypothetical protein